MEGFHSWTVYEKKLIKLRQYYDFTYYLYEKESEVIKNMQKEGKISFNTPINITNHNVNSLGFYIKTEYPQKLRELMLINLRLFRKYSGNWGKMLISGYGN